MLFKQKQFMFLPHYTVTSETKLKEEFHNAKIRKL